MTSDQQSNGYRETAARPDAAPARRGNLISNLRTFSSLRNKHYRYYFVGMFGQWASMSIQQMSNSLLIYSLTGSTVLLGAIAVANSLPMALFSFFGGVIADRVPKKHVLVIGLGVQAVIALSVAIALSTGYLSAERTGSWWLLILTSFLQGSVMAFLLPSQQAVIPEIVKREQVTNAVALNTMGRNVLLLLAPASSGFLIAAFGYQAVFLVMTGLYAMGVFFVSLIPITGRGIAMASRPLQNIKEGFGYVSKETIILFILFWSFWGMGSGQVFQRLMPIFADDILKVGPEGMGLWLSIGGAGAIISSLTVASITPRRRGFVHVASSMFHAVATIFFCFNQSFPVSLGLMFLFGLGNTSGMMMTQALLQDYAAEGYRGRVFSMHTLAQGTTGILAFLVALLATSTGAPWAVAGFSMTVILLGFLTLIFNARYRRLA